MPDIRKEIIRPGVYTYLNQSGQPERMTVTADTIKHFHAQGTAMLADGLSIPVPIEHQPENPPKPLTASERAASQLLNNAGFVKGYEIKDDRLFGILDIPDPNLAKKLPTTIRSVSPWINSFVDGNGKDWQGVVSHVALTLRPRIAKQNNFETVNAAMSVFGKLTDKVLTPQNAPKGGIALTPFGRVKNEAGKLLPEFPIGFSLTTGVMLSADDIHDVEDDDDDDGDSDMEGEAVDDNAAGGAGDAAATAMADDAAIDTSEDAGDVSFEELIPHLEMHGIHVPGGGKGKEFLQALVRGLLASAKALAQTDGGADDTVLGDKPADPAAAAAKPPGPIKQESPPMYMSLTQQQVQAIADPKERQIAEAFLSIRQENSALKKNKLDEAAATRQKRIDRLLPRVPAGVRDKRIIQIASSPSAALSMGGDGVIRDPIALQLEAFEAMVPDLRPFDASLSIKEQPHPQDVTQMTNDQAAKLADDMLKRKMPVPKSA